MTNTINYNSRKLTNSNTGNTANFDGHYNPLTQTLTVTAFRGNVAEQQDMLFEFIYSTIGNPQSVKLA